MNTQDVLSIVSIGISVILSIGAIVLSIWFYLESNKQNKETALMQADIKNAIAKLEQLLDRTYTDTFGALRNQMDAMQKHIFSSVGNTNASEPDQIRFSVLGCITEKSTLTIEELCSKVKGHDDNEIKKIVYNFHKEGVVNFDGTNIKYLKNIHLSQTIEGQGQ